MLHVYSAKKLYTDLIKYLGLLHVSGWAMVYTQDSLRSTNIQNIKE